MRFILVFLILLATPLWADEATDRLSAEARAMIYAHDIDGFRTAITAAHAADLAAKGDQNMQRALYRPFTVTDPRVTAFTADWLAAEPDSPYALIARVWHLRALGIAIRGSDLPRFTWHQAMEQMGELHGEALTMALRARDLAPDLVAASDAVIRLSQGFGIAGVAEEELARIMAIAPNHGSILRAANSLAPKWGGSVDAIARVCEKYAPQVPDVPGYTVDICLVEMFDDIGLQGAPQTWSWNRLLELPDHPHLINARKSSVLGGFGGTPETNIAALEAYIANGGTEVVVANQLDYLRAKQSWSTVATYPDAVEQARETARAELAHDAGNPQLVEHYFEMVSQSTLSPPLADSEQAAILEKLLTIAPYNVDAWTSLAYTLPGESAEQFRARANAATNAVVYSNHKAQIIAVTLPIFAQRYHDAVQQAVTDANGDPNTGPSAETDTDVTCPYVRLVRLLEYSCAAQDISADECARYPKMEEMQADLSQIAARGICEWERTADIDSIMFTPATGP
jgi:hypothetical protein